MTDNSTLAESTKWRPRIHFTPKKNWMNDPNGLVYLNGKYHLFFQYNPFGSQWGNMSWGHAISENLLDWEEVNVALPADPENLGYIFSGSVVVDKNNTSGFMKDGIYPLVAIFTHHSKENIQRQSIAYSLDEGLTWQNYILNPVIDNPGIKDFRDPKVFWHEESKTWVMVLACGQFVRIYTSNDLKQWHHASDFGHDIGSHTGEWECPDLFPLTTNSGKTKWVMLVSMNPGGPNSGSATQYFVGDFNDGVFYADNEKVKWLDFGPDNYAGVSFNGLTSQERRVTIGWMSNWSYAAELPTSPWRGSMAIPRELTLNSITSPQESAETFFVSSLPCRELLAHGKKAHFMAIEQFSSFALATDSACVMKLEGNVRESATIQLTLTNAHGEKVILRYIPKLQKLIVDRRKAGFDLKLWTMPLIEAYTLPNMSGTDATIVLDSASIEVFWHGGSTNISAALFPTSPFNHCEIQNDSDDTLECTVYLIKPNSSSLYSQANNDALITGES